MTVENERDDVVIEFMWMPKAGLTVIREATASAEALYSWRCSELTAEALVGNTEGRVEIVSAKRLRGGDPLYTNVNGWLDQSER